MDVWLNEFNSLYVTFYNKSINLVPDKKNFVSLKSKIERIKLLIKTFYKN